MQAMVAKNEIAGAVTVVVTKDKLLHLESIGLADVAAKRPMTPEMLFWIASMTAPISGTAMLMRQRMRMAGDGERSAAWGTRAFRSATSERGG